MALSISAHDFFQQELDPLPLHRIDVQPPEGAVGQQLVFQDHVSRPRFDEPLLEPQAVQLFRPVEVKDFVHEHDLHGNGPVDGDENGVGIVGKEHAAGEVSPVPLIEEHLRGKEHDVQPSVRPPSGLEMITHEPIDPIGDSTGVTQAPLG